MSDENGPEVDASPLDGTDHLAAAPDEFRRAMWIAASELIVDLGYASRAHFVNGQDLRAKVKWLQIPRVVFPVIASGGTATLALFGWTSAAIVFGFLASVVIALDKALDPVGNANAHTDKADRLLTVYKDLRYFRSVTLRSGAKGPELERGLGQLRKRADEVRALAPRQVSERAYAKARSQIAEGQASHRNDPLWDEWPESP